MSDTELSPLAKTETTELPPPGKTETNDTPIVTVVVPLNRSSSTTFCKICLTGESSEPLLQPCLCKGTVGNIHLSCLERWINECGINRCELCLYQFASDYTPRYTAWRSIVIWSRHPTHRRIFFSDSIVLILMTVVFGFMITSFLMGLNTFQSVNRGSNGYTIAVGNSFFAIFIMAATIVYIATMFSIIKDNILPWYRWWKNCNYIRLNREILMTGPYP